MPIIIQALLFNYDLLSGNVILRQIKTEDKRDQWACYDLKLYGLGLFESCLLTLIFTDLRPG